jgi:sugar phosphate isomerase/epimerase
MLRVGLNPYGLTYTTGLLGAGTPRANPHPIGLIGFIALARDLGARCIELDDRWLRPLAPGALAELREQLAALGMTPICSSALTRQPGETLDEPIRCAAAVGASIIRLGLTPVLEGARATWGARWDEMAAHARSTLIREVPRVGDAGLIVAIENHQDFGSEELVAMAEAAGDHAGIVVDTGNPFSVAEDPVAFTRRVAPRVRHVHLKDYRAQFTDEGYRLIRCAIGDGCVPLTEMVAVLAEHHASLTASIEPGALEARHIRAFAPDWWRGYPPRDAAEFVTAVDRLRHRSLARDDDYRTPWERNAPGDELAQYELSQMHQSVDNLQRLGFLL